MEKKKERFGVGVVLLVSIVLALSVLAARLPTVGGDSNTWGTVMNDFLNVAHESGGNIKSSYITGGMIAETTIERGDLADNLINSSKITDGGVANRNINESAINGTQIVDVTIGAIDIATNIINTTHIAIAGLGGNALANNIINTTHIAAGGLTGNAIATGAINASKIADSVVNTTHILDQTIGAIDVAFNSINTTHIAIAGLGGNALANNIINTTHIVAGGLTGNAIASYAINNSHIAVSSINASHISNAATLNITSLAVTGVNRTTTGVPYPYFNISGIFFNRTIYDLPNIPTSDCANVDVNMTGIPANSLCIFVGGDDILLSNVQAGPTVNLTFTGMNSTAGNCRVRVCNVGGLTAANPSILTFAAIGIAGNGL